MMTMVAECGPWLTLVVGAFQLSGKVLDDVLDVFLLKVLLEILGEVLVEVLAVFLLEVLLEVLAEVLVEDLAVFLLEARDGRYKVLDRSIQYR